MNDFAKASPNILLRHSKPLEKTIRKHLPVIMFKKCSVQLLMEEIPHQPIYLLGWCRNVGYFIGSLSVPPSWKVLYILGGDPQISKASNLRFPSGACRGWGHEGCREGSLGSATMMAGDVCSESGAQPGDMEISHFSLRAFCVCIYKCICYVLSDVCIDV